MISVETARKIIFENTLELEKESIHIKECLNRVLAEDIFSEETIPLFDNSAMDGYAVVFSQLQGAASDQPVVFQIVDNLPAGYLTGQIVEGNTAVKIMTGAPVPIGADTIVPLEFAFEDGSQVKIFHEIKKWSNIRFSGEDVKKGQLVIPRGKTLGPSEIGMLAALNISSVKVVKLPVVSLLSTGDELVDLGEELSPGKIRNINTYSLCAQIEKHGGKPMNLGIARDTREAIKNKLENAKDSDVLIISGGISVGDYDYVKDVLFSMGMEEKFWKVAMRPGKPVLFGVMGKMLVFGLPGNPVATMVTFEQLVLPSIYKMQGKKLKPWKEVKAIMEEVVESKPGLFYFMRGKTTIRDENIYVKPIGSQSSGAFSSMVLANCMIMIPEEVSRINKGEEVQIQIMKGIGE